MKTLILMSLLNLLNLNAIPAQAGNSGSFIGDEAFVNDCPINTSAVFNSFFRKANYEKNHPVLADEAYVDDVPFNTARIFSDYQAMAAKHAVPSSLQDEVPVEDPLNTGKVAGAYFAIQKVKACQLKPEPYVDDVPVTQFTVNRSCDPLNPEVTRYIVNFCVDVDVELVSVQTQGNQVQIVLSN